MKRQYLGDSKDCFKWDYHDYLISALDYKILNILLMMTPDDNSNDGKTKPGWFPARKEIVDFCKNLSSNRDLHDIKRLPLITGSKYNVNLHKPNEYVSKKDRLLYFTGIASSENQLVFIDPDNGFEPEKSINEKHVRYSEVFSILDQISSESIISVFQYFRRIQFTQDFIRIRQRLRKTNMTVCTAAIFWQQLMFVMISKSEQIIRQVRSINKVYSSIYPVKVIE